MQSFWFFVASILFCISLQGCNSDSANKKDENVVDRVRELQQRENIPAVALTLIKNDRPQFAVAGKLAIDSNNDLVVSDLIPLASDSKAFTASLLARLVEQGLLHWDDKIGKWLSIHPSFENLTLEQLLRHESGLIPLTEMSDVLNAVEMIGGLSGDLAKDQRAIIEWVMNKPARFVPGSQTEYSNANYVVAGFIAEIVAKIRYEDLVRREVFIPLGISGESTPPKNGVLGHLWENQQWRIKNVSPDEDYINSQLALAAGGWYMSMPDYAVFLRANIDGLRGQGSWLKQSTLEYMHSGKQLGQQGMGWQVLDSDGERFSQHLGSDEESYLHGVIFSHKTGNAVAFFVSGFSQRAVDSVSSLALELLK